MQKLFYPKTLFRSLLKAALSGAMLLSAGQGFAQGAWSVYTGNALPNASTPAFVISGAATSGGSVSNPPVDPTENSIIDNPDVPGSKVLNMRISNNPHTAWLWRHTFAAAPANPTAATIAIRAKGLPSFDRVLEMDLDFGGFRETIFIFPNGTYTLRSNSTAVSLGEGFNPMVWHTYRFTKSGASVNMYLDENNTPTASVTTTVVSATNNYFRFGDGNSSATYGALIDWVAWDVTGAYSPSQLALPSGTVLATKVDAAIPAKTAVYPNPLNGSHKAMVSFTLPTASDVNIQLYDITGKKVGKTLALGNMHAASHEVPLAVAGLSKGVYFCHISTGKSTVTQKLVVN